MRHGHHDGGDGKSSRLRLPNVFQVVWATLLLKSGFTRNKLIFVSLGERRSSMTQSGDWRWVTVVGLWILNHKFLIVGHGHLTPPLVQSQMGV